MVMAKWAGRDPRPGVEGIIRIEARTKVSDTLEVIWASPVLIGRRFHMHGVAVRLLEDEVLPNREYQMRYKTPQITYEPTDTLETQ